MSTATATAKPGFDRQGTAGDDERLDAAMKSFVSDFSVTVGLHLESCVHCGLCAKACHFHLATGEARHTPIWKLEPYGRFIALLGGWAVVLSMLAIIYRFGIGRPAGESPEPIPAGE